MVKNVYMDSRKYNNLIGCFLADSTHIMHSLHHTHLVFMNTLQLTCVLMKESILHTVMMYTMHIAMYHIWAFYYTYSWYL